MAASGTVERRRPALRRERQHDPDRVRRRPARAGAVRGGVHGGDRARRHLLDRRGADRGGPGVGHVTWPADAANHPAAGDAGHRPAHRQRDDRHDQGHVAGRVRALLRAVLPVAGHRRAHLSAVPDACCGLPLVSRDDERADGGAALPRTPVRPWHPAQHRPDQPGVAQDLAAGPSVVAAPVPSEVLGRTMRTRV